ncbi:unnamed protein product [Euphydryas editha]|uniref:Uncharacterized protein n=1 Tax=Euphydryas editha TaxID=104508 RepID=A0AAU9V3F6_EUPED|nr:unnamed protein product [Euphydryas editha]
MGILSGTGYEDAGGRDRGSARRYAHVLARDCRASRRPLQQPCASPARPALPTLPIPPCHPAAAALTSDLAQARFITSI